MTGCGVKNAAAAYSRSRFMETVLRIRKKRKAEMKHRSIIALMLVCASVLITGCASMQKRAAEPGLPPAGRLPEPEREFRAAWIATVANINWPSKPGLSTEEQKNEAISLLDLLAAHNFNAAIFQVRPQCDAMYPSQLEPWSYYLTGVQGQAPEPYYDPLEFWVEEAHKRGIELHVWLNPYRAHHISGGEVSEHSIVNKRPDLAVKLEGGYYWLDPARQETQDHSLAVVMDIVERYDIDGVHFDDYFYPYPSYNNNKNFPDDASWAEYQSRGGKLSRDDWRRAAVDRFIKRLYKEIKHQKPHVKFGLSPFGIWRPHNPKSIRGFDQYDKLYADARRWLNEGWIDYWSPQLYWSTNKIPQSFPVLLGWWAGENRKGRHFWPGISIYRGENGELGVDEVLNQIMITRGMLPQSPGVIHWSIAPLQNPELIEAIHAGPYKKPALIPRSPWLDRKAPVPPQLSAGMEGDRLEISWSHENEGDIFRWVVYYRRDEAWEYAIANHQERAISVPLFTIDAGAIKAAGGPENITNVEAMLLPVTEVAVTAVDRVGNESEHARRTLMDISYDAAPTLAEIAAEFEASQQPARSVRKRPRVKLGVEVLVEENLHLIEGKRVGLITNPSAVGSDLRSSVDILVNTPGVDLVALFGAEHGLRGAEIGRIDQEGEIDPQTGIPIYSLYGDSFAPRREWLEKLDVLLFDIQGVGSAWYTFKYSMSFAMEACAEIGIPFIVLDRPNPLGGRIVEGPLLDLGSIFRHRLPLRHGMTYGELATMWNETEGIGADLTVVRMKGWRRSMTWDDTGLFWVMPSPNMGTLETAIVYPGQCLFERMNMSEGRGTTKPFLMVGAPWVDCGQAAKDLNSRGIDGAVFRPVHFIPRKLTEGADHRGKPWNEICCGIEIMLTDYEAYRSVAAALHIIDACRKTSPDSLVWSPPAMIKLLDEPGATVEGVVEKWQKEVADFVALRGKYLLYR